MTTTTLVLRSARPDEAGVTRRLAALDSAPALRGEVVFALVGDQPVAAASLLDGRVVADPFEPTADVVELLREFTAGVRTGRGTAARARSRRRAATPSPAGC